MSHNFIFSAILICSTLTLGAQENEPVEIVKELAEELAENGEGEENISSITELLRLLQEDPVRINDADENEISHLFFLTGFQVKALCDYARNQGPVASIYEIANIPGFNRALAQKLEPFISFEKGFPERNDSVRLRQNLLINYTLKSSDIKDHGPGPPWKMLTRYGLKAGKISTGFITEKDAGEKIISGSPPLPDFISGYVSYRGNRKIRELIIGDFNARFGQGLVLNSSASVIYSLTTIVNLSGREDLKQSTSADENAYFRGIAAKLSLGGTDLVLFGSSHMIDVTLQQDDSCITGIKSLYTTGLHNSSSGIEKKDAARLNSFGGYASHNTGNLRIGILLLSDRFSYPFNSQDNELPGLFDFRGSRLTILSGSYSFLTGKFILSGELAGSYRRSAGAVQTIVFRPDDRLIMSITGRYYSPYFTSFHGRAPGLSSFQGSEKTVSASVIYEAASRFFISAGTEVRNFYWLRYRSVSPSSSIGYELKARYSGPGNTAFEVMFRSGLFASDVKRETGISLPSDVQRKSVRFTVKRTFNDALLMSVRLDYAGTGKSDDNGVSLLGDTEIKLKDIPLTIWFRYCIFSTGSFSSAVYTWENDLLHSFSVPALYGRGSRMYIMLKISPWKNFDFRLKYGNSYALSLGQVKETDELKFQLTGRF